MPERGSWQPQWIDLAEKFPASLVKDAAPEALKDGSTPAAYGLGLDNFGYLYAEPSVSAGEVWSGAAFTSTPTSTPLADTQYWRFAHNRLWGWRLDGTKLYYGAYGYDSNYILDGLGYIPCEHESSAITDVIPFGDKVAVFKGAHLYIIRSADNPGNGFVAEYVKQASGLVAAGNAIAVDGALYWANADGVWSYDGGQIVELSLPVRNNIAPFSSGTVATLRADFDKRRVIGRDATATKFIVQAGGEQGAGLFDYSTAGFLFTTRTLVGDEAEPLLVDKIALAYRYETSEMATVTIAVKINDTWKTEDVKRIRPADDNGRVEIHLANALACRRFAVRITQMSSGLYVSKIMAHVKQGGVLGYSNK